MSNRDTALVRTGKRMPQVAADAERTERSRSGQRARRWSRDKLLVGIGLPGAAVLIAFQYLPLPGNVIAFQDYQPYLGFGSPLVGSDNFTALLQRPRVPGRPSNTLNITPIQLVLVFPAPLALALFLNSLAGQRLKRLLQSVLYLPHFLSWVIVVALFQQVLGDAGC